MPSEVSVSGVYGGTFPGAAVPDRFRVVIFCVVLAPKVIVSPPRLLAVRVPIVLLPVSFTEPVKVRLLNVLSPLN